MCALRQVSLAFSPDKFGFRPTLHLDPRSNAVENSRNARRARRETRLASMTLLHERLQSRRPHPVSMPG